VRRGEIDISVVVDDMDCDGKCHDIDGDVCCHDGDDNDDRKLVEHPAKG